MKDNAISARVLLGVSNKRGFLGDFRKISLRPPFALFEKMQVLGDLAKISMTWPFGHCFEPVFAPKSSPVFAL